MISKINIFKALSDETRLRVINLFIKSGQNLCVCEIMDALKIPQYAVSKALTNLKNAELLTAEKRGTWVYYDLNKAISDNKSLFSFLKNILNDNMFEEDEIRLNERLLLREKNRCVVGIVSEKDLIKMIKEKTET